MTIQSDMALMAAGSYWDIRRDLVDEISGQDRSNRTPTPTGWRVLTAYDVSDSGPNANTGFSGRVYENIASHEIVISYGGTEFNTSSYGLAADFLNGNIPLALGSASAQALAAAKLYQRVKADPNLSDSISFTGHSLGGGIASVMAVWFDRPAYLFAAAPFQAAADATQATLLADIFSLNRALPNVRFQLGSTADAALLSYSPTTDFATREANVKAYAIKGELLEDSLGMFNWIEGSTNSLFTNTASTLSAGDKHSIDLHVAALLSDKFQTEAGKLPTALERLMDKNLYGGDVLGNQQVIITKLIRNEVGVSNDSGTQVLLAPNGMLTHFANDLGKLGTNIAGLNKAAQDAFIAQGIEWYYWQGGDYAGQQFFVNDTGQPSLLQYTTAQGDGLAGAKNKAVTYLNTWLTPVYNDSGEFGGRVSFDQWSVAASAAGVTSTARDTSKTQIFIGQCGADSFTGGDKADTLLGGAGDDTLVGGAGNDIPAGGAGTDNYEFDSAGTGFCNDTITDSDGLGQIKIGGATATGGKLVMDNVWESGDRTLIYSVHDGKLIIGQRRSAGAATVGGTITVNNWQNGLLGVNLQNVAVEPPAVANAYSQLGQTRTYAGYNTAGILIAAGSDNWLGTGNGSGGATFQGEDGQAYSSLDIAGLIGNDILYGFGNADKLDGGEGDDVIFGGLGADQIQGGAGNDVIMSNVNASNSSVNWTPENAALYPNALDWSGGTSASLGNEFEGQSYVNGSVNNWTIKRDANGNLLMLDFQALRTGSSNPANNDLLYGGEGNDLFVGNGKFATKLIAAQARDSGSRYRFSSEAKSLVVSNHRQCPQPTQQGLARRNTAAHDSHLRFPA